MTTIAWPGPARTFARVVQAAMVGAALTLAGCAASFQGSRDSSMLAVDASCTARLGPEADRPVDPNNPDPGLMGEALRYAVNRERCARSLAPLGGSPAAMRAADGQARAMARHGFTGHRSPVAGRETFAKRLTAENARFSIAGENVAQTALYAVGSDPYEVVDAGRCLFRGTGGGPPIPQQSYRMLAERLVFLWMRSAEHRENMLRPRYRRMGTGVAVRPAGDNCGQASAAAVFLG